VGDTDPGGSAGNGAAVEVRLLGGFGLLADDKPVSISSWRLRKAKDVVKLLALAPGHRRHRDEVLEALWPERDPESGLNNLHQALHIARRGLAGPDGSGRGRLRVRQEWVALCPDEKLLVDVEEFEAAAAAAGGSADAGQLAAALRLYPGDLLPEDRYEDWVLKRRDELHGHRRRLVTSLAALREAAGDPGAAVGLLTRLVADDPADEVAQRGLIRAYALSGDRGSALRQHQALVAVLRDDLAVTPDAATDRVYQDVLAGKLSLASTGDAATERAILSGPPPGPAHGDHAGKNQEDLSPERHHPRHHDQKLPAPRDGHHLPVTLSTFIGRDGALAELTALLGERRLVTLTGPGGCGKTRLAVEVARRALPDFPDGAWLVDLAAASGAGHNGVGRALAQALSLRERSGQSPLDAVTEDLAARRALLVIDNCEHRIDSAAHAAGELLRACPRLVILATSREPLRVPSEALWQVPSLTMSDPRLRSAPAELAAQEAVRLFAERAKAAEPGFRLDDGNAAAVAEICFRLDGLPLAIELAAARIPALGLAGIAGRLDDRFRLLTGGSRTALSRQRTLAATFDWSYELLSEPERAAFRRLSVFAETFSLPAAAAVAASTGAERDDMAFVLADLVAKSMIAIDQDPVAFQYRLIETLREYGRRRLAEAGETAEARRRHAAWYLTLAQEAADHIADPGRRRWLERIDADQADFQTALDTLQDADPAGALRLAAALWPYWLLRGNFGAGTERLEAALGAAPEPSPVRAEALLGVSAIRMRWAAADQNPYALEALEVARSLGDPLLMARTGFFIGAQDWSRERWETARPALLATAAAARTSGLIMAEASAVHALACVAWSQELPRLAWRRLREALALVRRAAAEGDTGTFWQVTLAPMSDGEWLGAWRLLFEESYVPFQGNRGMSAVAFVQASMGSLARAEGDHDKAHDLLEESLALFEETGDEAGVAMAFGRLGNLAIAIGKHGPAREYLARSLVIRRELQDQRGIGLVLMSLARAEVGIGRMDEAGERLNEAARIFRASGDRPALAGVLLLLGELLTDRARGGDPDTRAGFAGEAVRLLEVAVANLRIMGYPSYLGLGLTVLADAQVSAGGPARAAEAVAEAIELLTDAPEGPGRDSALRRLTAIAAGD
jgi:predicted ATPase/DNA-binding SARP family transcriptional activator